MQKEYDHDLILFRIQCVSAVKSALDTHTLWSGKCKLRQVASGLWNQYLWYANQIRGPGL